MHPEGKDKRKRDVKDDVLGEKNEKRTGKI